MAFVKQRPRLPHLYQFLPTKSRGFGIATDLRAKWRTSTTSLDSSFEKKDIKKLVTIYLKKGRENFFYVLPLLRHVPETGNQQTPPGESKKSVLRVGKTTGPAATPPTLKWLTAGEKLKKNPILAI